MVFDPYVELPLLKRLLFLEISVGLAVVVCHGDDGCADERERKPRGGVLIARFSFFRLM
jgi:hypothetical protein